MDVSYKNTIVTWDIVLYSFSILLHTGVGCVMYEPSVVSEWYEAVSDKQSLAELTIKHDLGMYPVKVDVQVKITEGGQDFIFSGIGSSQRDDDLPYNFSGVVYRYNQSCVQLAYPFNHNYNRATPVSRGLAYIGYSTLYDGPSLLDGPYIHGFVRIRAWLAIDMPQAESVTFKEIRVVSTCSSVSNELIYMQEMKEYCSTEFDGDNYKELTHGLGSYPDIVTVRTLTNDGYMSDGIGVVFLGNTSSLTSIGGVLFGYDETKIRLWVPSDYGNTSFGGRVFVANDGYLLGGKFSGTAYILGWQHDSSQQVFYSDQLINGTHDSVLNLPFTINLTNYLVSVQFKIPNGDGPNGGMMFYAAGTTQANTKFNYGGLLYVYNENQVLLWHPTNSPMVYIGGRWGRGQWAQESDHVNVIVKVYFLRKSECPYPDLPGNATYEVTGLQYGDIVIFTCIDNFLHLGGDLIRTCERNRRWSGAPPSCIECPYEVKNKALSSISGEEMTEIITEIRVIKSDTGAYRRTLISAHDKRFSAQVIGLLGVFILVTIGCLLFIPDIYFLIMHARDYGSINKNK